MSSYDEGAVEDHVATHLTCAKCGYGAHGIVRVLVMVDGKATAQQNLCREHLLEVLDAMAASSPRLHSVPRHVWSRAWNGESGGRS